MKILLTGGTGMIGQRLLQTLPAEAAVHGLSRNAKRAAARVERPGLRWFDWDFRDGPPGPEAWDGVDTVIHLMGENIAGRWTTKKKKALWESRIDACEALKQGMTPAVKHFLCASAIGYYPGTDHEKYDESYTCQKPNGFMQELCVAWENSAQEAATTERRVVNMRIGLVLGKGDGVLQPMVPAFRLGGGAVIGDGRMHFPWVHLDDLVGMMQHLLMHPEIRGPFNLVAPSAPPFREFAQTLASVLGRPLLFKVPAFVVKAALGEAASLLLGSFQVDNRRARESGYNYLHGGLAEALQSLLKS